MSAETQNAFAQKEIVTSERGRISKARQDSVAREEPLEIRVRGQSVAVTMRTPGHDEELAAGFLRTEGVLTQRSDVIEMGYCASAETDSRSNILNVFISPDAVFDAEKLTRHVFANSSCGICGKASVEAVHQHFPPVPNGATIRSAILACLPEKLRATQTGFAETGGLHGAAIFTTDGELLFAREDVGRHNAVDKVIGAAFLGERLPLENCVLLVSGRVSFEITQKALAAAIPIIAAVSAPTSLAIELAEESNQTLIGFLRGDRFNIYSHPERLLS
jgi:FdhD protein